MATLRSPDAIFAHHGQALGTEDFDEIVSDYAEDADLIVQGKTYHGRDGARHVFSELLSDLPKATWELETVFAGDILYLEWKARGENGAIGEGVDTFVFRDGLIQAQTVRYTLFSG